MLGRTISHYTIIEKIGEGGMGIVYKAEDLKLERPVALKFLSATLIKDKNSKLRFINEAKAASNLQHVNICTITRLMRPTKGNYSFAWIIIRVKR